MKLYSCPICGAEHERPIVGMNKAIQRAAASINGARGKGKAKARTSEQARAAVMARWEKHKKPAG
jgi:hypothetical protein